MVFYELSNDDPARDFRDLLLHPEHSYMYET